jgi:glycosyltransferase involved in cell wall biosynthesis
MDPSLLRHVPASVHVHRCFTPEVPFSLRTRVWSLISPASKDKSNPSEEKKQVPAAPTWKSRVAGTIRRLFTPDPEVVWVPFATRAAKKLIKRHGIGTVLLTAPPFSVFITGNRLKRRFPDLRIVADFRDEWLTFYLSTFDFHSSPHIRERAAAIEREVVEAADVVLTVTPTIERQLVDRYPDLPRRKFVCLPNGYDPAAFTDFHPRPHGTGKIVITYMGTVYKASTARYYLDALDSLPDEVRSRFETRFIGRFSDDEKSSVENRKSAIQLLGFLPQAEAFRRMEETDYLLMTMTDAASLTGKLFDYLATGKPILAISPAGGEVDKILRDTRAGWCAPPDDPGQIRELLLRAYFRLNRGENGFLPDQDAVACYTRPGLTAKLADLIRAAAGRDPLKS